MKRLHRRERDLYSWSVFNERLDIDFNSFALVRQSSNVLIDPLPLSPHDKKHLQDLGGAHWVVVTNSDHVRAAQEIAADFGAKLVGPDAERATFPLKCDRWLKSGDEVVPGLVTVELEGSKTAGELALILDKTTLFAGDLIRCHQAGSLVLLKKEGITDYARAAQSIERLLTYPIEAVLVGDGYCVFRDGRTALRELIIAP